MQSILNMALQAGQKAYTYISAAVGGPLFKTQLLGRFSFR